MIITLFAFFKLFLSSSLAIFFALMISLKRAFENFEIEPFEPQIELLPAEEEVLPLNDE